MKIKIKRKAKRIGKIAVESSIRKKTQSITQRHGNGWDDYEWMGQSYGHFYVSELRRC